MRSVKDTNICEIWKSITGRAAMEREMNYKDYDYESAYTREIENISEAEAERI